MSVAGCSFLDSVYRCLADSRRRAVLGYLLDAGDGSAMVDELVDAVVQAERRSPSPDRESVEIALVHSHLPLLADERLVDYHRDSGVVSTTTRTEQTERYLDHVRNRYRAEATAD